MEILPLIDIAEPDRITALLEAPDTFSFRADAAENLDGLVPDIGLTGKYPYRSVYRPRSFAQAGLPATLTHRFWDTLDGSDDHTGRRWIGVVMYDEHGFDCRLEVTLGADPIGRMVPFRHDNRRHLYVLDRPVQFMGEMEVLRISGTGDAGYRLEHVVLLKERPAATSYQPRLERLTARLRRRPDGGFAVAVDAVSRPAARCRVELVDGATGAVVGSTQEEEHLSLHAVELEPVPAPPAAGYRARIVATEAGGKQETAEVAVTGQPDAAAAALSIPMEITNLAGVALSGLPATFGLPVPPGHLFGPHRGALGDGRRGNAGAMPPARLPARRIGKLGPGRRLSAGGAGAGRERRRHGDPESRRSGLHSPGRSALLGRRPRGIGHRGRRPGAVDRGRRSAAAGHRNRNR